MEQKLDKILNRMNEIENNLKTEISEIKNICLANQQKYTELESTVKQQQATINYLSREVNRNNIIIFGLKASNSIADITHAFIQMTNQMLHIDVKEEDISKIYQLKQKNPDNIGPIKVGLYDFKLKSTIVNARTQLKGSNIFINEDLPLEYRIRNKERRLALAENNKKRLKPQSSEESEPSLSPITQDPKKIKVNDDTSHKGVGNRQRTTKN